MLSCRRRLSSLGRGRPLHPRQRVKQGGARDLEGAAHRRLASTRVGCCPARRSDRHGRHPGSVGRSMATRPPAGPYRPVKKPVTPRLNADIVTWFKEHAHDRDYRNQPCTASLCQRERKASLRPQMQSPGWKGRRAGWVDDRNLDDDTRMTTWHDDKGSTAAPWPRISFVR